MKKHWISGVLLAATLITMAACGGRNSADTSSMEQNQAASQDEAARKALDALRQLVGNNNFGTLGFASADEAKRASLGPPTTRRVVGYDNLVKQTTLTSFDQVFSNEQQTVYPVQVDGATKSSVSVTQSDGHWRISSVADAYLTQILTSAQVPEAERASTQIISIPGINLDFLSYSQQGQTVLVPAQDYPELQMNRGRAMRAEEALPRIASYAAEFERKYGEQLRKRQLVR